MRILSFTPGFAALWRRLFREDCRSGGLKREFSPCNRNVTTAMTTKIITSHFAISMERPAIPVAPKIENTRARTRKITARKSNQPFFTRGLSLSQLGFSFMHGDLLRPKRLCAPRFYYRLMLSCAFCSVSFIAVWTATGASSYACVSSKAGIVCGFVCLRLQIGGHFHGPSRSLSSGSAADVVVKCVSVSVELQRHRTTPEFLPSDYGSVFY